MSSMTFCRLIFLGCLFYSVIWSSSAQKPPTCPTVYEIPVECQDFCQLCKYRDVDCFQPLVCIPGCDCLPNFLRNEQKQCIPAALCPGSGPGPGPGPDPGAICPPFSVPSDCTSSCDPSCRSLNPEACPPVCQKGCVCINGYVKDDYGNCIPPNQCPSGVICPPFSVPSDCASLCDPSCRNLNPEACAPVCQKGCVCINGYVKDDYGNCIPPNQCPPRPWPIPNPWPLPGPWPNPGPWPFPGPYPNPGPFPAPAQQCPSDEFPVECIDRCQRCEYKNGNCSQAAVCTPGCNCLQGFLRNNVNKCIPIFQCP